jgi:cytochrome c-type biogenesis protein
VTGFFDQISGMIAAAPLVAISGAFLWGLAGVLLSPCHLVSVPLLVGYLTRRGEARPTSAALLSLLFGAGILVTVAAIGVGTALAGRMLGDIGSVAEYVIGALLVLFGLYLIGLVRLPALSTAAAGRIGGSGGFSVFLIGLVFGVGLGPCTFAFLAPVLVLVISSAAEQPWLSAGLLGAFAVGHSAVIVGAGTLSQAVRRYLNWDNRSSGALWLRRVCGALVAAGGVYLIAA